MSKKKRGITSLDLEPPEDSSGQNDETPIEKIIQTLTQVANQPDNLDQLFSQPDWREAINRLCSRPELAETIEQWFENSQFALRIAAIQVAARWVPETSEAARWLPLIRNAILDNELSQWISATASREAAELKDPQAIQPHIRMLAREILTDWHESELARNLEALLGGVPDQQVVQQFSSVPLAVLESMKQRLGELRIQTRPGLLKLSELIRQYQASAVDTELLNGYGRLLGSESHPFERAHHVESVLDAMQARLNATGNRSFILVGPSGVGKTAVIRELARHLQSEAGKSTGILEASTIDVMAETRYLGEWQTRLRSLVSAIQAPRRIIWYLPDLPNIFSAGRSINSNENFADLLIPLVQRGEIVLIGESTPEAFRTQIEISPAARQTFPVIRLNEPTLEDSRQILASVARDLEEEVKSHRRRVQLPDETLDFLGECADRYFWGTSLPGRQVRLLKELLSDKLQESGGKARQIAVDRQDILKKIAGQTGIPLTLVDDSIPLDLEEVARFFAQRILGQAEARRAIVDRIALIKAGLLRPDKPLAVFFFVGPTGVGKTEMAKALAEFLFGSADRLIRIDMSELMDYGSFEKLIGSPRDLSYSPSLLSSLRQQPFSVVLLDEFEKAHPNVFDLFLQVFDNGRLTDAAGQVADFRQSIIIMTSNLGSQLQSSPPPGFAGDLEALSAAKIEREMARCFRPEFINRIDQVITFNPLDYEVMEYLARQEIEALVHRTERFRRNILLEIQPSALALVLKQGFSSTFGARPLKRQVEQLLAAPLARQLVGMNTNDPALLILSGKGGQVAIDVVSLAEPDEAPSEVRDGQGSAQADSVLRSLDRSGRTLNLAQCRAFLQELKARHQAVHDSHEDALNQLRQEREASLAASSDPSFWDDNLGARRQLAQARHQELVLAQVDKITDDLDRLGERLAPGKSHPKGAAEQLGEWLAAIPARLDEVEVALTRTDPLDHYDVFLTAHLLGTPEQPGDSAQLLLKMYENWLQHRGARCNLVDQRWNRRGDCRSWTLRGEGMTLYGWLRSESGLHRFVSEASSDSRRSLAAVRISVLADQIWEDFPPDEVRKEIHAPSNHPSSKSMKTSLSLIHLPTLISVQAHNDLPVDQTEADLSNLLHARVEQNQPEPTASAFREGPVVRQYTLAPSPLVKDPVTRLRSGHLESVLGGNIDPFLLARIRRGFNKKSQ